MAQPGYVHHEFPKWLHHPKQEHPSVIVRDEEEEAEVLAKWHVAKDDAKLVVDNIRDNLLKRAEALGIKVDARWSDKRLQSEVEKHAP